MTSTSKRTLPDSEENIAWIISALEKEQKRDSTHTLFGNYPSWRYHRQLPLRRKEDNVYFVSWINQVLSRSTEQIPTELRARVRTLIDNGEQAIAKYRNRYGDITYNFYRPQAWFPNGRLLSRFGRFQPTDDSDDTSIAYRGKVHSTEEAAEVKKIIRYHSNGLRNRTLKRLPSKYRQYRCYSTWIGSEHIYVDTDLVVLSNVLIFNASYDLGISEEDRASLLLIEEAVISGDYLKKKWSLAAWYPFEAVILYSLADMIALDYYSELITFKEQVIADLESASFGKERIMERLLIDSALIKLGRTPRYEDSSADLEELIDASADFSFGVIPLLHPYNGRVMQYLSSFGLTRLHYECKAQRLCILLENILLRGTLSTKESTANSIQEKGRTRSYKPDSVNSIARVPHHLSTRPTL